MLMQSSSSCLSLSVSVSAVQVCYIFVSISWTAHCCYCGRMDGMYVQAFELISYTVQGESLYVPLLYLVIGTLFFMLSRWTLVEKGEKVEYAFDFVVRGCSLWYAC